MNAEHDEIQSSLAGFLLGATDGEEAERIQAHLEGCSSCQALASRLQRTIGALPLAVELTPPPVELRGRIVSAASSSRQSSATGAHRPSVRRIDRPRLWPKRTAALGRPTAVAAAALLAFALGAGLGLGAGRATAPQPQPATVAQFAMTGSGAMTGAVGHVYELRREGLTLVEFSGLPQAGDGKIYELWLIPAQGQPVPASVFYPDAEGSHFVVLGRNLQGIKALAVTQEVAPDGASAPTQVPLFAGAVA